MNDLHDAGFMTIRSCCVRHCSVIGTMLKAACESLRKFGAKYMLMKRIIGTFLIGLCAASAASAAPVATASSSTSKTVTSAQKTIPCSEYKRLTGLDVCYVKPELLVAQSRYDALVKTYETGTCLEGVAQTYGTLECRRLGDAFQAWQGRDVTDCQQAVLQCRGLGADRIMTRVKIERTEIPTARARFRRLGLAYGEVTK